MILAVTSYSSIRNNHRLKKLVQKLTAVGAKTPTAAVTEGQELFSKK